VAEALLSRPVEQLPIREEFIGAGVYVIYYIGQYPAYERIAYQNRGNKFAWPIYVGKAVPPGSRTGALCSGKVRKALYKRLIEHATSIEQAKNLETKDFFCRYLVTEDIWIPLAESLLIQRFSPIWNKIITGFGIHTPGENRPQQRSRWDVLHPGRTFAENLPPNKKTEGEILKMLAVFLSETPVLA